MNGTSVFAAATDRAGSRWRRMFIMLWALLLLAKVMLGATLPLFGDEAFYWQEGQHLAWAYSDLPGLTAWLARLGVAVAGPGAGVLGLRWPFLVLGALLPWVIVRVARRWFEEEGADVCWRAGVLALLLPLIGGMGVLALPDVPMTLAAALCLDAAASLLRRVSAAALMELAFALAMGALSHYRFAGVIAAGLLGLLLARRGRALLRHPLLWLVLTIGAAAWLPLLLWNLGNHSAGLQFQLVERHPWRLHASGALWPLVQAIVVTPLLLLLLLAALRGSWRRWRAGDAADGRYGLILGSALLPTAGYFILGWFADSERVSFHWPLVGYLPLLALAPCVLRSWPRWARIGTWATAACGLAAALAFLVLAAVPALRARLSDSRWYPDNFAGWHEVAAETRDMLRSLPPGTPVIADNFMLGAELGFALNQPAIPVLDHPLNHKHGRAPQLRLWRLELNRAADELAGPALLVVEDSARPLKLRLDGYAWLCRQLGTLPRPQVLNVDHGRKRFLLFALPAKKHAGAAECAKPALAWIDRPLPGSVVQGQVDLSGWAFKDGPGIARVEVTLDGVPIARADYGAPMPNVAAYWKTSTDPNHPKVGLHARLDLRAWPAGTHWLGLRLHGADGSVEDWPAQRIELAAGPAS